MTGGGSRKGTELTNEKDEANEQVGMTEWMEVELRPK